MRVSEVLAANSDSAARYRAGRTNILGLLVGLIMKKSADKVDPRQISEKLKQQQGTE